MISAPSTSIRANLPGASTPFLILESSATRHGRRMDTRLLGGANALPGLSLDPELGMVFAVTGSPGQAVWHFQGVKHDVWDLDFPAAPGLVKVTRDGKKIDAVAQITKTGFVLVFDRRTGTPLSSSSIGKRLFPRLKARCSRPFSRIQ
jgi:hypothetical protein